MSDTRLVPLESLGLQARVDDQGRIRALVDSQGRPVLIGVPVQKPEAWIELDPPSSPLSPKPQPSWLA